MDRLHEFYTDKERFDYLAHRHTCLYVFVLKLKGMYDALEYFMQKCRALEDDW